MFTAISLKQYHNKKVQDDSLTVSGQKMYVCWGVLRVFCEYSCEGSWKGMCGDLASVCEMDRL